MKPRWLILLLVIVSSPALAQSEGMGSPCLFEAQRGVVPDCIRKTATGALIVAPVYLKQLDFDSHGLAPVESALYGWMYVSKNGTVVVSGVPTSDNWADEFHNGLVRIVVDGKYGFADRRGRIVIRPKYEMASPFDKGVAAVCVGCYLDPECAKSMECEHREWRMVGGQWFLIDLRGRVLRKLVMRGASGTVKTK